MRRSGPDGMSRMPVASTTSTPGLPSANRRYQSITSRVTRPSSVARHGTIAGTHVRDVAVLAPSPIGWNSLADAAASAVGHAVAGSSYFRRSGGCHMVAFLYHTYLTDTHGRSRTQVDARVVVVDAAALAIAVAAA